MGAKVLAAATAEVGQSKRGRALVMASFVVVSLVYTMNAP